MITGLVFLNALLPSLPAVDAVPAVVQPTIAVAPQDAVPVAPAAPVEPKWTGSINIGASYSDGNTDSRSINAAAEAERRAEKDRWTAKGFWNYGQQRDSTGVLATSDRRAGASLKYDYFMSKKLYLFGIASIDTDLLADISMRYYAGGGVGYQWEEEKDFKWGSEAGVTYYSVDFDSSPDKDYPAARLANNIAWQINEHTKLENTIEALPSLDDVADFYGKSDTKVKANLSKSMFAQLQWVYQYTSQPATGKARNDNLLVLGVGWGF